MMLSGEGILFSTAVEATSMRRRASRLLAMAGAPRKLKTRELVLTTHRLVCLKHKAGRAVELRLELFVRPSGKDKDARHVVNGVEPKGEREFVVLTPTKSHSFVAATPDLADAWVRKIREAIETYGPSSTTSTTPRQNSSSRTRS